MQAAWSPPATLHAEVPPERAQVLLGPVARPIYAQRPRGAFLARAVSRGRGHAGLPSTGRLGLARRRARHSATSQEGRALPCCLGTMQRASLSWHSHVQQALNPCSG